MKFNVGDKVKVLLSASCDGIDKCDLGRCAIVEKSDDYHSMYVRMLPPSLSGGWWIDGDNLIPLSTKGQQLVFNFMMP